MAASTDELAEFWLYGYGYAPLPSSDRWLLPSPVGQSLTLTVWSRSLIWKPPPHFGTCAAFRLPLDAMN
ncbi:hypothetical protein TPAR_07798 [Tolypocladium paradoxum]|uniref:Uncharacterized protein n=1 Tax=Tolypocladium paradoxum TaxID=94208 RepID=A0A2S4KP76_9HYPO|nr:hypothetical protein TPAR_07798 [Tolypocladium paradoxum]